MLLWLCPDLAGLDRLAVVNSGRRYSFLVVLVTLDRLWWWHWGLGRFGNEYIVGPYYRYFYIVGCIWLYNVVVTLLGNIIVVVTLLMLVLICLDKNYVLVVG